MINFIVNNASVLFGGLVAFLSCVGIYALSKESKKLSKKPAEAKTSEKKDEKQQKTKEKSVEKVFASGSAKEPAKEPAKQATTDSSKEKITSSAKKEEQKSTKEEKKDSSKKKKGGARVEKLIDTRERYSKPRATTIEESLSDERNEHITKLYKDLHCCEKKIAKKFSKSKQYTFVSTRRKGDIPKYMVTEEEKDLLTRMTFVKNRKGSVAKLAKRDKMLKMPSPTLPEPEFQPVQEEKQPELTAEEKRHLKYAKYFDKSRRISRSINEDNLDSLFDSHLSDAYMDINIDRHLNIGKKFDKKLYSMASKVLAHGEIKILDDANLSVKANRKEWLKQKSKEENKRMRRENREYEDFLDEELRREEMMEDYIFDNYSDELDGDSIAASMDLSPKNILMVDSVLYRDRKRRRTSGRLGRK